jgi:hypothetical protein
VPDHQVVGPRWRLAVLPRDDLAIGTADPDGQRLDEQRAVGCGWLRDLPQIDAVGLAGDDSKGLHPRELPMEPGTRRQPTGHADLTIS